MIREDSKNQIHGKMFGIGYYVQDVEGKFTDKMIEMDAYDIYYRHGAVGSFIYFAPLLLLIFLAEEIFQFLPDAYEVIPDYFILLLHCNWSGSRAWDGPCAHVTSCEYLYCHLHPDAIF